MRTCLFFALLLAAVAPLPAQEYVPPPTPTPTPTPIPGSLERPLRKLFLEPSDLPTGMAMKKQLFSASPEEADAQFVVSGGVRIGYREWQAEGQGATIYRLSDIRFVFVDEEAAEKYIKASYDYLRDGADDIESSPGIGNDSRAFGSRLRVPGKPEAEARGYIYVFRERNVVARLVLYQGTDAGDPLDVWSGARVAQKIQERLAAALRPE